MSSEVTFVRIYVTEGDHLKDKLLAHLHDKEKVRGVTLFRGIAGFGASGELHSSRLLDMSLDLPLVVEFFDEPAKVAPIIEHLKTLVEARRIVSWQATVHG